MAFLIRTIDHTASGREIVRDRELDQETLTIGRASGNDIHLPDLAVEQDHVRILPAPGGQLRLEAVSTLGFALDGRTTTAATFDPREGCELSLGSSILSIAREGDGPVTVTIRQGEAEEGKADVLRGFALASVLPSKRLASWALLGAILIAFLTVPVVSHLSRERIAPNGPRSGEVAMDASWSTGPLSLAHHGLEDSCESCHVDAFVSVRDETCLTCHEDIADHAQAPRLAGARGPMSWGDGWQWAVAQSLGKEGPGACTTCHTEHEGATRMEPVRQQFCADCHESMDARLTDTALGNAHDFGKSHPEFQPAVFTRLGSDRTRRISLSENPKERSGLKFPHDIHLDPQGGAARMAIMLGEKAGYGEPLVCSDCHTPEPSRVGFEPVEMEENCESCHSLVYDRVGDTFRSLRHGDVESMRADLRAMDRSPRRPVVSGRSRPGQFRRGGLYYQNFGPPAAAPVGTSGALAPGGVCGECHIPTTTEGRADVTPVNLSDRYFLNGGFDHDEHRQEDCVSCHKADQSNSATDLLLPELKSCRQCHLGEGASAAEVPSGCAMCHSYHVPSGPVPDEHPGQERETIALLRRLGL